MLFVANTEPKGVKRKPWLNTSTTGNTIGIALLVIAAKAAVAVLATQSVLAGIAVLVRETTGLEILPTVKVESASVEAIPVVMVVCSQQASPKVEAAVGVGIVSKAK